MQERVLKLPYFQYEWSHRAKRREIIKHVQSALGSCVDHEFEDEELEKLLVSQ